MTAGAMSTFQAINNNSTSKIKKGVKDYTLHHIPKLCAHRLRHDYGAYDETATALLVRRCIGAIRPCVPLEPAGPCAMPLATLSNRISSHSPHTYTSIAPVLHSVPVGTISTGRPRAIHIRLSEHREGHALRLVI